MSDRLLQYSALAAGIVIINNKTEAQVMYTDIEPDLELYYQYAYWLEDPGWQYIDLDADGINDVGLSFNTTYGCGYCPTLTFFNVWLSDNIDMPSDLAEPCYLSDTWGSGYSSTECVFPAQNVAKVLFEGDTISELWAWDHLTDVFQTHRCGLFGEVCVQGDYNAGLPTNYLAFRKVDEDTLNCWLRLTYTEDTMRIADFACILNDPLVIQDKVADQVRNLYAIADSCTGNTDELLVHFEPGFDEATVSEYRIMVSPTTGFKPDEALLVAPSNYISVLPTGGPYNVRLPADFTNYIGDALPDKYNIRISVFSIYHFPETNSCSSVTAAPVQYGATGDASVTSSISFENTGDTYSSADLQVSADGTINLSRTSYLRVITLRSTDIGDFTIEDANAVESGNYYEVPAEPLVSIQLPPGMRCWNGEHMEPDVYYKAVILAIPKAPLSCISVMSNFSPSAKFFAPLTILDQSPQIIINQIGDAINIQTSVEVDANIELVNAAGQILFADRMHGFSFSMPIQQPPGMYFVRITNTSMTKVEQLVVH